MNASAKIDWISATYPADRDSSELIPYARSLARAGLRIDPDITGAPFHRGSYNTRLHLLPGGHLLCSDNRIVAYATVEFTGSDCDDVVEPVLFEVLRHASNISRLDIAIDIETDMTPREYTGRGYDARFTTKETISSSTGETVYIGSRKSDRYVRVYRYTGPEHPRSHLLRIEFVLKDEYATGAAGALTRENEPETVESIARGLIMAYGLSTEPLEDFMRGTATAVKVPRKNTSDLNRWAWLVKQVKPALMELEPDELERLLTGVPAFEHLRSKNIPF